VTVESGFNFVFLFWILVVAGVLVYGVVAFVWFLGLLRGGFVLEFESWFCIGLCQTKC